MTLEIEACFDGVDDTPASWGEVTPGSGWDPEFLLAGDWVTVEFHAAGATMRVEGDELPVFDGAWHEGKLLGIQVRGRLR